MSTPHLDRLLFMQGGLCFFCRQHLPRGEASIEHLVASANGGTNSEENCVACCRTLNSLLGSKSIKEKLQIVLNQRGDFRCPRPRESAPAPGALPLPEGDNPTPPVVKPTAVAASAPTSVAPTRDTHQERLALVLEDLRKRGNSRPRKEATLMTTIQALIKQRTNQPISDANLKKLLAELQQRGQVTITEGKVAYKL
jgi:hypothetical protein